MIPVVVGDFTTDSTVSPEKINKENRVLLCAQKNLSAPYIEWIRFMRDHVLPNHPDWKLIVKLHPLESEEKKYMNEASDCVEVLPISASLNEELVRAKIQVSIYSTTFFDALGMNVKNYSLNEIEYSSDYAAEMVELGVAESLKNLEDVIAKYERSPNVLDYLTRQDVFSSFQPGMLNFI
jgi:hypothetical protein